MKFILFRKDGPGCIPSIIGRSGRIYGRAHWRDGRTITTPSGATLTIAGRNESNPFSYEEYIVAAEDLSRLPNTGGWLCDLVGEPNPMDGELKVVTAERDALRAELESTKAELSAVRVAFSEASHNAGPAFVAHEELNRLRAESAPETPAFEPDDLVEVPGAPLHIGQLRALCKQRGIAASNRASKAELLAALDLDARRGEVAPVA